MPGTPSSASTSALHRLNSFSGVSPGGPLLGRLIEHQQQQQHGWRQGSDEESGGGGSRLFVSTSFSSNSLSSGGGGGSTPTVSPGNTLPAPTGFFSLSSAIVAARTLGVPRSLLATLGLIPAQQLGRGAERRSSSGDWTAIGKGLGVGIGGGVGGNASPVTIGVGAEGGGIGGVGDHLQASLTSGLSSTGSSNGAGGGGGGGGVVTISAISSGVGPPLSFASISTSASLASGGLDAPSSKGSNAGSGGVGGGGGGSNKPPIPAASSNSSSSSSTSPTTKPSPAFGALVRRPGSLQPPNLKV